NVISLMDALRRSVQAAGPAPAQTKKGRKRVEGQREMLLPIAGKQAAVGKKAKPERSIRVVEARPPAGKRSAR
ncbi:MAG TPA: Ku protein, partial [Xanthobacteraceae bacterium]